MTVTVTLRNNLRAALKRKDLELTTNNNYSLPSHTTVGLLEVVFPLYSISRRMTHENTPSFITHQFRNSYYCVLHKISDLSDMLGISVVDSVTKLYYWLQVESRKTTKIPCFPD